MRRPFDQKEALREYRKRNFIFWGLFLGLFPAVVFVAPELARLFNSNEAAFTILTVWAIAMVVAGFWRGSYRCPRCRKRFYYKWWYKDAFTTKCVHCRYRPAG